MQGMGRGRVPLRRPAVTLLVTAVLTLAIDQTTKVWARALLAPARSIAIIPGVFELSYIHNTGAAFGVLAGGRSIFIATSLVVLAGIAFVWFRYHPRGSFIVLALGLVSGGALGNLIDRVVAGQVTDFLYLHYWPVFNVADSAIVVGVAILVLWLLFRPDEEGDVTEETVGGDGAGEG
jgi:signal peptidase II